ncbi:four helix bundle protein [Rhodopirellula baltica]|uniref:23S rRNA-associated protein n=1 Tax=Rhodopirellula baltica WH47 TaxID=991778 RepID=F2ALP6_RHOBT|nr:four helix bundle protein [Rhodopirellula baltica]EGF29392.1 23S rRNA-associated protein [Rhodopirellula baltica WH47]
MDGFEELECYQKARAIRINASAFCKTLPKDERFRLVDQMIRASRSVTANIAEGYGRHHHQEHLQYLRQARGSLYETLEHYHTALDENYLSIERHQEIDTQIRTALRILNGYIRYIRSRTQK